jgi:cytochrome bd-type quinol oxidase subunit 1
MMLWDALPDALLLARIQFAFTVSFHFLFPAITIGLASYLAVLEGLWLWTRRELYLDLFRYWLKVFAVNFAMGVVSGIVLSYQFGTNWSVFSDRTGPVLGPLLGYEVLTAFFLEAGFLGVMLFGLGRVGRGLHFTATCLVAIGTLLSGFWILSANSWMHTPAGFTIGPDGRFLAADWWAIVFNPSFPFRYLHTITAAFLATAMLVGAVGAWHLLRDRGNERARVMFSMAMWMAAAVAPAQAVFGDLQGLWAVHYQPQKVAAMEGHWETQRGAPLILFGLPDMEREETRMAISIPRLGSLILTHEWDGEVVGLKAFPPDGQPRAGDDRARHGLPLAALARPAVRAGLVPALGGGDGAKRADRGDLRLDHHRGRAAALYRLWADADRRKRQPDRRAGGGGLAHRLRRGVFLGVRGGALVPVPAVPPSARAARGRAGAGRAHPYRGDHTGAFGRARPRGATGEGAMSIMPEACR